MEMGIDEYITSEQAFKDVWERYNCPDEINGTVECFDFLNDLMKATKGQVIVDHFSGANYDHIHRIEKSDDNIYIYWKDFSLFPPKEEFLYEVMGGVTFLYTLCNLRKIKFLDRYGHIFVLFFPNVISLDKAKGLLQIKNLEVEKEIVIDKHEGDFVTRMRFIKEGEIHECTLVNFPFYSFLIQPKEGNTNTGFSNKLLVNETINYAIERLNIADNILNSLDQYDNDGFQSVGNRVRTILESMIKFHCLFQRYSLPKNNYGDNMLGALRSHLVEKKDDLVKVFSQSVIKKANNFSHDNGGVHTKKEVSDLMQEVNKIINEVYVRSSFSARNKKSRY